EEGQLEILRCGDRGPHRLDRLVMSLQALHAVQLAPAAVAIHDHRHMLRHQVALQGCLKLGHGAFGLCGYRSDHTQISMTSFCLSLITLSRSSRWLSSFLSTRS